MSKYWRIEMNECKPCITLRTILKLLWKNYVIESTNQFKQDCKSYRLIGQVVCVLPKVPPSEPHKNVLDIREKAMQNFDANKLI